MINVVHNETEIREAAALKVARHINARLTTEGATLAVGDVFSNATAIVKRWKSSNVVAFNELAKATGFLPTATVAKRAGTSRDALGKFLSRMREMKVSVIGAKGVVCELDLFRHGHETFFQNSGIVSTGESVDGGIRLKLNTDSLSYDESCNVQETTKAAKVAHVDNFDGAVAMAEGATARDKSTRDRARAEFDATRERRVNGPQLSILGKTGTDAE